MPRLPRLTAADAEAMLIRAGFAHLRSKGGHRIYIKENRRVVLPFHPGKMLHPKVVRQVIQAIEQ